MDYLAKGANIESEKGATVRRELTRKPRHEGEARAVAGAEPYSLTACQFGMLSPITSPGFLSLMKV